MSYTNFPNGITSFGVPVTGGMMPTCGNIYFVKPYSGSDSNDGTEPGKAFKTLTKAHAAATANQNDIIYMYAESNTAANTTDYQSTVLTWSKNSVHLIGVNAGQRMSHRSRIAFVSTYDTATPLVTVSANGCLFANIEMLEGVAGTTPLGCLKITGQRNHFLNCHIAGIGNDANDIAGAYSLELYGNASENYFESCVIGLDTIGRGSAANSEILFTYGTGNTRAARTIFKDCIIQGLCASAGNYTFLTTSYGLDRYCIFDNCIFSNPATNVAGGAAMTYAMITANANGYIILHNTSITGAADMADNPGNIVSNAPPRATADPDDLSITWAVTKS